MSRLLAALALGLLPTLLLAEKAEPRPGFGVVESVTPLRVAQKEPSASTGSSVAPAKAGAQRYRVRVRLDDGTVQTRIVRGKPDVAPGDRALLTNAGDVLPE